MCGVGGGAPCHCLFKLRVTAYSRTHRTCALRAPDIQTYIQTDIQTYIQTDRHTYIHTY
jgi:hypothetical protein